MRKHTTALLLLLLPQIALGAAALEVADTVAGIGTEVTLRGLASSASATVSVEPPYGPAMEQTVVAGSDGTATMRIQGKQVQLSGVYDVSALDAAQNSLGSAQFTVKPDTVDPLGSSLEVDRDVLTANSFESATVTVVLRDQYGNPLPGRPVELVPSNSSATVTSLSGETDELGEQLFDVASATPGMVDIRAMDLLSGKLLASSVSLAFEDTTGIGGYATTDQGRYLYAPMTASMGRLEASLPSTSGRRFYGQAGTTFDIVDRFEILIDGGMKEVQVYDPLNLEIRAVDRSGRVVEDYTGSVYLYSTDPESLLPAEVRFGPSDFGVKRLSLSLRFETAGEPNTIGEPTHVIRAEEAATCASAAGCIFGETEVIVRGSGGAPGSQPTITVTNPVDGGTISTLSITVEGNGPPYVNLQVTGGERDALGETDGNGSFAIPVTLNAAQTDHTLRVRDPSGRFDSGNIRVRLDTVPPVIGAISFDPLVPKEGKPATVSVSAEPKLRAVGVSIGETQAVLTETASGTYTGTITPTEAGSLVATVSAADQAGNIGETRVQLTVEPELLDPITGVKATAKIEQIELTWDALQEKDIDGYRIYIGTHSKDYSTSLDSLDSRAGATIGGLKPGTTYYFAVTAIQNNVDRNEKSAEISATPLGLTLTVTPQDGALLLEWASLSEDIPLSTYTLEYGAAPGDYIEKRTLSGEQRAYALRDLLNGVTYYVRLTPITTTGEVLGELAAEGQGTPAGAGFKPTPADAVPLGSATKPTVHSGAPSVPRVGIPPFAWWIAGAIAALVFTMQWQRRRTMRATMEFLRAMETQYKNG